MLNEIFDINKFNIYSDDDNYYFFRALNMDDNYDIENGITLDSNDKIEKIRTNRERYNGIPKYNENDNISLKQIVDHIKMHQLKETNCISLTSNANTALTYGRGSYKDKYVIIKVPKEELGSSTYEAGLYMLEQINNTLNNYMVNDEVLKEYFNKVDNCNDNNELEELKQNLIKNNKLKIDEDDNELNDSNLFEQGYSYNITNSKNYISLNDEQNLEKNKIVLKIDLLNKQILPKISNRLLIQTVGNAFSSLELVHYGEIKQSEIIELPNEITDIFGLIQQMPADLEYIDEIKKILINKINHTNFIGNFTYNDFNVEDNSLSIENLYKITEGKVRYAEAIDIYKKAFYLSKSKLRTKRSVRILKKLLDNNPKYYNTLNYILKNGYGIEPEITTRHSKNLVSVSESVSIDINKNKSELVDYINSLDEKYLAYILDNPNKAFDMLLPRFLKQKENVKRSEWIADAIIDKLDLSRFNIKFNLRDYQRDAIKSSLIENDVERIYFNLKRQNVSEKNIANVLFTNIIKNKTTIDLNDTFTLEELEYFIGYNRVKGTGLTLRKYQNSIVENINRNFESRNFTSVILPTGAGKSYIALAQMYQFEKTLNELNHDNHAKILYLAPNDEILNQLKDIIRETYKPEVHLTDKDIDQDIKRIFPNLTLSTYQNLKDRTDNDNNIKEIFETKYDLIIFDELHRTGAREWKNHIDELIDNQDSNVKVLGITATPERDMDSRDMTEYWARKFRYTKEEILEQKHLSYNMDIIEAIKRGIVVCPKIINCIYNLKNEMDELKFSINEIKDNQIQDEKLIKYEKIRRTVDSAIGIEQVLNKNIKEDGKYIVFLPITRRCEDEDGNTVYEDENGNKVKQSVAHQIINDYQILFHQYLFSDEYLKNNADIEIIYNKIISNERLTNEEINYLYSEKDNILLLSKFEMKYKQNDLISQNDLIASEIINFMKWEKISKKDLASGLKEKMKDRVEDYSMLGSYGAKANKVILDKFNKPTFGKAKLMFVMNKLNEGVHVKGISGIVWMRPLDQKSRILFLQQLGRCIKSLEEDQQITENDIPIVIDLVNNSLKVKLEKNHSLEEDDLENILMVKNWINSQNRMPSGKTKDKEEIYIAKTIIELQDRYTKYLKNKNLLKEDMNYEKTIIKIGCDIDIWDLKIKFDTTIRGRNEKDETDDLVGLLGLESITRDFIELKEEVENQTINFDKIAEFIEKLNENYKPKKNDPDNRFSNGDPISHFWQNNKEKIVKELMTNQKYEVGYDEAKKIVKEYLNKKENELSLEEKISEFIEKLNENYKPKYNDSDNRFSNGDPINKFWQNNKEKIVKELMTNQKYEVGYDEAKKIVKEYLNKKENELSLEEKISEFIEKLNENYKPKYNDSDNRFSNGDPISHFWQNNKEKIVKELMTNQKYEVGYDEAKKIVKEYLNKKENELSLEEKISEFIEKLNENYKPKYNDSDNRFSNGDPISHFWQNNKEKIVKELMTNQKYEVEYERAKKIVKEYLNKKENELSLEEKISEFIEKLKEDYKPKTNDPDNRFSNGDPINKFWQNNKEKIVNELMTNQKYEVGYERAKKMVNLDKISEFIEKLKEDYKPKKNDPDNRFSNGEPISHFWQNNKEKIVNELMTNQKYEVGYERAKKIVEEYLNKKENELSLEEKISEFIEKLNENYKPKSNDPNNRFSNGDPINRFWFYNKEKIVSELMTSPKYEEGYDEAKNTIIEAVNKSKKLREKFAKSKEEFEKISRFEKQKKKAEQKENSDERKLS